MGVGVAGSCKHGRGETRRAVSDLLIVTAMRAARLVSYDLTLYEYIFRRVVVLSIV